MFSRHIFIMRRALEGVMHAGRRRQTYGSQVSAPCGKTIGRIVPILVVMARKTRVLSIIACGAGPAAAIGTLVKQAIDRGWTEIGRAHV